MRGFCTGFLGHPPRHEKTVTGGIGRNDVIGKVAHAGVS